MSGIIGIALTDDLTSVSVYGQEALRTVPTVVCRDREGSEWTIGEEAKKKASEEDGILIDRLVSLMEKNKTSTIDGIIYDACSVIEIFLRALLGDVNEITSVVISIRKLNVRVMDMLTEAMGRIGVSKEKVRIVSHTESFAYYMMAQDKNLCGNLVGMFELSNQCLYYYELKVMRGNAQKSVTVDSQAQDDAFNLDILKSASGQKIADKILLGVAQRMLAGKVYSSIFLSGDGFSTHDFAPGFMDFICSRRRVCVEPLLFCIGASLRAAELAGEYEFPYRLLCETRILSTVSLKAMVSFQETEIPVVKAGDSWYQSTSRLELITDDQDYIEVSIVPSGEGKGTKVKIPLQGFPQRPSKTTRVLLSTKFVDAEKMIVTIKDKGFGDLFPATDAFVTQEIDL